MEKLQDEDAASTTRAVGSWALVAFAAIVAATSLGAFATLGTPPGANYGGEETVSWFREHREAVRWSVWFFTVGAPPLAVMFALLRRLLPAPHRDVFLIGVVAYIVALAVQSWFWCGLALHADQLEPALARAILDVAVMFGPVFTGTTMTMIAPVTLLAVRGRAGLPRWLGILGGIAFVEQAIETVTIFGSKGFTQPGGPMNLQLGAGLTLTWILAFGFWAGFRRAHPQAQRMIS